MGNTILRILYSLITFRGKGKNYHFVLYLENKDKLVK